MNVLRSICCLFGSRCEPEQAKSAADTMRAEADLGQTKAGFRED